MDGVIWSDDWLLHCILDKNHVAIFNVIYEKGGS